MPPDRYTVVTISAQTTDRPAEIITIHDLESVADAIDYAADAVRDPETLLEAELAQLLYRRPAD